MTFDAWGIEENGEFWEYVTHSRSEAMSELSSNMLDTSNKGDKAPGVSLYFNGVLFWADGPKLGGSRPSAAEMFKGVVGSISSEDPTGGAHDSLDDELVL